MAGSVTEQISAIFSALSSYAGSKATAVAGSGSFPGFTSMIPSLDASELDRYSNEAATSTANYSAGMAADATHLVAAALREYTIRARSKSDYYSNAVRELQTESGYYDSMKYFAGGTLTGNNTGSMA
jgi:hypothetical protein